MGDDLASPIGCGVDHRAANWDAGSRRPFLQRKGRRETGDPSTDDGDCAEIVHDVGQREDSCALGTETTVSASESESINIGHSCVVFVSRLRENSGYTKTSGCSKRPDVSPAQLRRSETRRSAGKAAASEGARHTLRYVEPLSDARTPLADFFSILLALTQLMHHVDSRGHMFDRCRREDPMAQIEDVSRTTAGPAQNVFHAPFDFMQWRK